MGSKSLTGSKKYQSKSSKQKRVSGGCHTYPTPGFLTWNAANWRKVRWVWLEIDPKVRKQTVTGTQKSERSTNHRVESNFCEDSSYVLRNFGIFPQSRVITQGGNVGLCLVTPKSDTPRTNRSNMRTRHIIVTQKTKLVLIQLPSVENETQWLNSFFCKRLKWRNLLFWSFS